MCGIVGILQRDGAPVDMRRLQRMTDVLTHRGPDDFAIWADGSIGLGHRRLSIRDLSAAGRQPISDPEHRITVSYNGEIYNDAGLRQQLIRNRGVVFRSTCDAETIPHAFLEWGIDAFRMFEGMFAIALWDASARTLHLARDAIGVKPLFYSLTDRDVVFGSEPKALFAGGLNAAIDPESLHALLATGQAGPSHSLFAGIAQVPPGSVVSIGPTGATTNTFWTPQRRPDIHDLGAATDALRASLRAVVESQLVSDVPVGVLLSGGIDSAIVTLAALELGAATSVYTARFSDSSYDETPLAMRLVNGALHHEVVEVDGGPDVEDVFRGVVHASDGQAADTGATAFYQLAAAVRRRTKVVLSGDGGDEFFAGYDTYRATRLAARLSAGALRPVASQLGRSLYGLVPSAEGRGAKSAIAARFLLGLGAGDAPPHLQWRRLVPRFLLKQLYGPAMRGLIGVTPYQRYANFYERTEGDDLDRAMAADQNYHLQSVLQKVDTMSMAHGLEVRVPLLDRRIMDLAGRIDASLLLPENGPPKHVLRELAARMGAPAEITAAPKKGFNSPIAAMTRGPLASLGDKLLDRNADVLAPFLSADGVRKLWREHREMRANHAFALWPILTLAAWKGGEGRPAGKPQPKDSAA